MHLKINTLKKILNLKSNERIEQQIADRQTEVIHKGFNHLLQEGNSFLYIGDEVGLGKTYIALGIASLLRAYSPCPGTYQDAIIVPKKNLQYKWGKEINNFTKNNYRITDNVVKSALGAPVGSIELHHEACIFDGSYPAYHIFRQSSFSLALNRRRWKAWWSEQRGKLPSEDARHMFDKLKDRGLFAKGRDEKRMKRLYAYLMNTCLPQIECLIIDEAHNYKHGAPANAAARNQVIASLMGIVNPEDEEILLKHPLLRQGIRPKVGKLIFLSATPMDRSLLEIGKQLDCFLPRHPLSGKNSVDGINQLLHTFMIRGLMEAEVGGTLFSRNQYRFEHRLGNVERRENAPPQHLDNDKQGLIMGLAQYATIKELGRKNNPSFEIGMLAGFESFSSSKVSRAKDGKEFEESSSKDNKAEDRHVISRLAESYREKFNSHLPHPKMDNLVEELFQNYLLTQEKALVFVRRIASSSELEQRLLHKYENHIYKKTSSKSFPYPSENLRLLLKRFEERDEEGERAEVFRKLLDKRDFKYWERPTLATHFENISEEENAAHITEWLEFIYGNTHDGDNEFKEWTKTHFQRRNFSRDYVRLALDLMVETLPDWREQYDNQAPSGENKEESDRYFFNVYFSKTEGLKFRKRMYTRSWFDLNLLHFNEMFKLLKINIPALSRYNLPRQNATPHSAFEDFQNSVLENSSMATLGDAAPAPINTLANLPAPLLRKTFITQLLLDDCRQEFGEWVERKADKHKRNKTAFMRDLQALLQIVRSTFRNGSGLLPTYIADSHSPKGDGAALRHLISDPDLFPSVLEEVKRIIKDFDILMDVNFPNFKKIQSQLLWQTPIIGTSGNDKRDARKIATQFRMPGFPHVLVTTDILKEGEDLHTYCQAVFHYGIAWNPTDMEQRTGRVDRIGSLNHRRMRGEKKVDFDNKVQVFFPYLADTLEVNQVKKVFDGMDRFIHIFYNDLSQKTAKDSKASAFDRVLSIPPQNDNKLESRYEHPYFQAPPESPPFLHVPQRRGWGEHDLRKYLDKLRQLIGEQFDFHLPPSVSEDGSLVFGDMVVNHGGQGRHGPFEISIVNGKAPGEFLVQALTYVCRARHAVRKSQRAALQAKLERAGFQMLPANDYIQGISILPLDSPDQHLINRLERLVAFSDKLEADFANDDAKVF